MSSYGSSSSSYGIGSSSNGSTEESSTNGKGASSSSYSYSSSYPPPEPKKKSGSGSKRSSPRRGCGRKPFPAWNWCRGGGLRCCPPPPPPRPPVKCGRTCFDFCQRIGPSSGGNGCGNYISNCRRPCMYPYHPPQPRPVADMCCCPGTTSCAKKQFKLCKAELERLRNEKWKEEEREAILEEKKQQKWMEEQYQSQVRQWEQANFECVKDRETRERLLEQIKCQRKEIQRLRCEAKAWRRQKYQLMCEQRQAEDELWAKQFCQRENELRIHQEQLRIVQEDKWLEAQTKPNETQNMSVPELEEMRRLFAPVNRGPNETFEYYLVEPRPSPEEMRRNAEMKMAALMGLRNECGMHFNCSDKCKKRTTVTVAMGPRCTNGECCKIITEPGAACCLPEVDKKCPHVPVPECLQSLMKTLSYRVNQIDSPLLRMKSFGPGPHFNGSRLYGTVVLPKGGELTRLYTDHYCVTY